MNAQADLNAHQIEVASFALQSPLSLGSILADGVGLGKTIKAGIVLYLYWAERKPLPIHGSTCRILSQPHTKKHTVEEKRVI